MLSEYGHHEHVLLLSVSGTPGSRKPGYLRSAPGYYQNRYHYISFGKLFVYLKAESLISNSFCSACSTRCFIMYIMNMTSICLMYGNRRTTHVSFILAVYDVTVFKYQVVDFALEGITKSLWHYRVHSRLRYCEHALLLHHVPLI